MEAVPLSAEEREGLGRDALRGLAGEVHPVQTAGRGEGEGGAVFTFGFATE
jgi:hypothetical protein